MPRAKIRLGFVCPLSIYIIYNLTVTLPKKFIHFLGFLFYGRCHREDCDLLAAGRSDLLKRLLLRHKAWRIAMTPNVKVLENNTVWTNNIKTH